MTGLWTGLDLIQTVLHPKIAQPSLNLSLGVPYFENWRLYNKNLKSRKTKTAHQELGLYTTRVRGFVARWAGGGHGFGLAWSG